MTHSLESTASHRRTFVRGARTLSIMPTYTCTAACSNCASLSSPEVRDRLPLQTILDAITQAKALGFYNVVFTGGEATLRWKDLLQGIAHAHALGFPTRLVTNAHWATGPEEAGRRIEALLASGLSEINYSTGDEHARFVPLERVAHASVAAVRQGMRVWVMVETRESRTITAAAIREHPVVMVMTEDERKRIEIVESPWMPLDPSAIEAYPEGMAAHRLNFKGHSACDNVLQTYTVQADGKVGACCGIGMRLIPELNVTTVNTPDFLHVACEEAEEDFLKIWIHYKGPEQVLAWAARRDPSIEWEGLYAHRCQACARVYQDPKVAKVVREHHLEMVADVLQSAWFDERYAKRAMQSAHEEGTVT